MKHKDKEITNLTQTINMELQRHSSNTKNNIQQQSFKFNNKTK